MFDKEVKVLGFSFRLDVAILFLVIGWILGAHLLCSCLNVKITKTETKKEGMTNLNDNDVSPNSWISKAAEYAGGMGYKSVLAKHETYKGGPVPLPEGQLLLLADNEFKPECCPATYSTGSGCACMSSEQIQYLNQRGGNRTMAPSEY